MNGKLIAGSILSGTSLLAIVLTAWAQHFFFTMFHVAKGTALMGSGSFSPGPYGTTPETVTIFLGTRVLMWVLLAVGVGLLTWGSWEELLTAR